MNRREVFNLFALGRAYKRTSVLDPEYGLGLHGCNVVHYVPHPAEIARTMALIRETWDEATRRYRREHVAI